MLRLLLFYDVIFRLFSCFALALTRKGKYWIVNLFYLLDYVYNQLYSTHLIQNLLKL